MKKKTLKIGNAHAFWGDNVSAAANLIEEQPDLDYLTLDFLAEVSLSIMAAQLEKDPSAGFADDFVEIVKSLIPLWNKGYPFKIVTNAGGLNPRGCALACSKILEEVGCKKRIAIVTGDNVIESILKDHTNPSFNHLETKAPISDVLPKLATANAYLGAESLVQALNQDADIIITGRVADPSLVVAPCIAHFNWSLTDYNCLAQATIAGHLIECGTQVTGGISSDWLTVPNLNRIGFPIIEMSPNGAFVVTKSEKSGGIVTTQTVKEQLIYEIGDPANYLSPDVKVSFLSLTLQEEGPNRIRINGGKGSAPPPTLKVSATYRDGFKSDGQLVIVGRDVRAKATKCAEIILDRMSQKGLIPERSLVECIGCGDVVPGLLQVSASHEPFECMMRLSIADQRREVMECFAKEIAPMVTSGPPGTTGYTSGRPHARRIFGYWPCLIAASDVHPKVEII